jgi:hypothetical protein
MMTLRQPLKLSMQYLLKQGCKKMLTTVRLSDII